MDVNRSVAKAIVRPSGDHAGCRSANASAVSCCSDAGRQRVDEQIRQPALQRRKHDARAVRRPARVVDLAEPVERNLARGDGRDVSRMTSTGLPPLSAAIAKRLPDGSQAPDERMYCRLSKCGSAAVLTTLRMIAPLAASARNRSSDSRSRSDMNIMLPPVGAERRREMQPGAVAVERGDSMRRAVALVAAAVGIRPRSTRATSSSSGSSSCPVASRSARATPRAFDRSTWPRMSSP